MRAAGPALFRRLRDHAKSLEAAYNLDISDFRCRYLVVVPVWITLAERFLLAHYRPVWNTIIEGFGNHDPGKGRRNMRRPRWDILHPGRPWAERLEAAETADQVTAELEAFLSG
ncbi:MAG: Eco29kI family restriction endonuclease [Candidatus Brocadiia bacterium]